MKIAIQEIKTGELVRISNESEGSKQDVIKDGRNAVRRKPWVYRVVELVNGKISKILPVLNTEKE